MATVVIHAAAVAGLAWSLSVRASAAPLRPLSAALADWLPLLLVPFLYAELPHLMGEPSTGGGVLYHDAVVQRWEAALFGGQPARTLAGSMPNVALSEILHAGYVLYYPLVYVPPLLLYLRARRPEYAATVLALALAYALCFLVFALFPVEGPRYAWPAPAGAPEGPVRWLTLAILERGSARGTAFPSSHAAVAAAQAIVALWYQRVVGVVVSVTSILLMVGAVYGGFHYAVDVLVGAVTGASVSSIVLLARHMRV